MGQSESGKRRCHFGSDMGRRWFNTRRTTPGLIRGSGSGRTRVRGAVRPAVHLYSYATLPRIWRGLHRHRHWSGRGLSPPGKRLLGLSFPHRGRGSTCARMRSLLANNIGRHSRGHPPTRRPLCVGVNGGRRVHVRRRPSRTRSRCSRPSGLIPTPRRRVGPTAGRRRRAPGSHRRDQRPGFELHRRRSSRDGSRRRRWWLTFRNMNHKARRRWPKRLGLGRRRSSPRRWLSACHAPLVRHPGLHGRPPLQILQLTRVDRDHLPCQNEGGVVLARHLALRGRRRRLHADNTHTRSRRGRTACSHTNLMPLICCTRES